MCIWGTFRKFRSYFTVSKYVPLSGVYRALLRFYRALLRAYRSLLRVYRALSRVCRVLLVQMALFPAIFEVDDLGGACKGFWGFIALLNECLWGSFGCS